MRLRLWFPRSSAELHISPLVLHGTPCLCGGWDRQQEGSSARFLACPARRRPLILFPPSPPLWERFQAWSCLEGAVLLDRCKVRGRENPLNSLSPGEGPAQEALQSLSRRLQVQEKEMELVKAALAEALRLLRLQAPSTSLQDPGTLGPPRDSPAAPPGLPPTCSPSLVSRGTQTEAEMEVEPSPGPPGLSNGPPAPPGGSEEPSGTQSEGGGSSSSGTGSPGPPGILRLAQPPQRTDTPRRNSSSSSPSERPRQKLSRKAASSANLLLRSGSTERKKGTSAPGAPAVYPALCQPLDLLHLIQSPRHPWGVGGLMLFIGQVRKQAQRGRGGKDPLSSPGGPGSRRSNYNLEGISVKMFLRGRPITMYIPSGIRSLEELPSGPPPETLSLDWVYGYRGRDSRSNLFVLRSGEVVYFIACVVVLYRPGGGPGGPGGGGQRHYRGHTDCVRCLAVHPDGVRVASGQTAGVDKDGKPLQPVVHVWDSETLLKLQEIGLGAFERGVGALAFSVADQGAFLCVVDDSNEHMLSVWDCSRGTKLAEIKSTNDSVLAVGFNPRDSSSIVTSGKSHVHFWNWNGGTGVPGNGTLTRKQGVFGKYKKPKFIPCFVFLPDGDILTGDSEGNILTWGRSLSDSRTPGRGGAKETYGIVAQAHAHEGSIFALCLRRDGTVLSGGGRDRRLVQWGPGLVALQEAEIPEHFGAVRAIAEGPGSELLVGTTKNALLRGDLAQGFSPVIQGHTDELWGLCTHPFQNRFLTCGHDRQLCLWDGEGHALAWSIDLKETGLCADFHPSGAVVAVGLNTGRWLVLDTETREIVSDITDGNEQLSVVRYSPDGLYLAIGSHDNMIYIYSVSSDGAKSSRFGRCVGHSSFITHLDWSKDGNFIMSNSGDYEILYWDVAGGCKLLRNRYESRDREWATYTCVLGFHVYGVWPDGSDGTDINSLCRSHNERVVAVADDFCKVHLFQYPCAHAKAPSLVYGGHGSHVTSVRFTHDDSHLISLGGKDASIFQWRVLGAGGTGPVPTTPSRTPSLSPASSLDV
ncbi:echinoderm microtubule-associated protein-like 3 isoform X2 [Bubalus bubalis]|uniref:echinoderm microtubule-associated protein-like 3 isoform X2 n=1 Tax=Bubalus bubalis TaxID=89462 RepID=UPI001E1B8963|nr:echinoderm microtubule-associated protein-like 3 isoform X2 [Bubalus bubalis]